MKIPGLLAITLAIVLSVSWLSIILYPSVQDFMGANPFWNGVHDFTQRTGADMLLGLDRLTPETFNVLIVIPSLPYQDEELQKINGFVNGGGTVLVMDDYGYGNQVLQALGLTIKFAGVPVLDPYLNYRNQWFPLLTDLAPEIRDAGINELVLNHATALVLYDENFETLARSSDMSYLDRNGNARRNEGEPEGPFAVAVRAKVGSGTVVAVSDPSILINSMVGRGDNDKFIVQLISRPGEPLKVAIDASHLPKAPLDTAKDAWASTKEQMALPYSQVLLVGAVLALSFISLDNVPWKGVKI